MPSGTATKSLRATVQGQATASVTAAQSARSARRVCSAACVAAAQDDPRARRLGGLSLVMAAPMPAATPLALANAVLGSSLMAFCVARTVGRSLRARWWPREVAEEGRGYQGGLDQGDLDSERFHFQGEGIGEVVDWSGIQSVIVT